MSNLSALDRARFDIENGSLGKARDRLHGLILAHPNDLSLRSMLADVYCRLQFPEMAGRYWYLEERTTPEIEQAVNVFERSVHSDPLEVLSRLKFRGEVDQLPESAREKLENLREDSLRIHGRYPQYGAKSSPEWVPDTKAWPIDSMIPIGCLLVVVIAVILAVIGLVTVIQRVF